MTIGAMARDDQQPFLEGGGEMAALIELFDWDATPLGRLASWSPSLRAVVATMLRSPVPIVTLWGEDGIMIYNDAYSVFAGGRHPHLLGSKVREGWPEVADFNDNVMKVGLAGGTLAYKDQELTLYRHGVAEQVWMNLDYSPIPGEDGRPAGVIAIVVETSAKVKAERWLQGERERLRQIFEEAPGFFALLRGKDYVFEAVNPAYSRLIGGRDVLGRSLRDALPEIAGQGFLERLDEVLASGRAFSASAMPLMLQVRPGEPMRQHFLDFVYQPVRDERGKVTSVLVQGIDATERVAAAAARAESERRFHLIAESVPVMLWMGDPAGKCLYLNRSQREFWGVPEDGVAGFDWNTTLHPDDTEALAVPFRRGMETQTAFDCEARYRRADGDFRILHTTARPRFGAEGEFLGMIGANVDVTEARQAEASLRQEASLLELLNSTGANVAAELDLEKVVQIVTDVGVEMTGASFGAFFYNDLNEAGEAYLLYTLSGASRDAFANFPMPRNSAIFRPTFEGEGVVRSDDILKHPLYGRSAPYYGMPPGHLPVRSYLAVPVISRSGEVLGGLFFGHEQPGIFKPEHERLLTGIAAHGAIAIDNARLLQAAESENRRRAEAEERLRALTEALEVRVAEEIADRRQAEAALQQAQKMEAIGQLTGGVAHDFNNLLQVIAGSLQLLGRDVAGNERAEKRIAAALAGVSRGAKLASQLLAFGRRQALEPKTVNVGRLVSGMDEMLRRTLGEAIEIETVISGGLWNSLVDPSQIENALLNLAINARDAMENGGKLTIEVGNASIDDAYARNHPDAVPGQYVMLAVTDTGTGIAPDIIERVFEPFFSTKGEGKGTGLGLSMVYGFVKQSGGHVRIYSEIGHGTTVKLYLPRTLAEEDALRPLEVGPIVGGSETIVVAEDDEGVRETVVEMLTELGYRVLKAKDATSALTVIESGVHVDLLFTDVVMPGPLKSPELARKVRDAYPSMAVLFTSGYTENSIVHGGKLDPGIELLAKPYTREALARKVRNVLAGRASPAQQAATIPPTPQSPARSASLTVLLVEDEDLIRANSAEMLKELGHKVVDAASAEAALTTLEKIENLDVLITDIGLPGLSGADLAAEARKRWPRLGVIFATGQASLPEGSDASEATLLIKPYGGDDVERAIAAAVLRSGHQR